MGKKFKKHTTRVVKINDKNKSAQRAMNEFAKDYYSNDEKYCRRVEEKIFIANFAKQYCLNESY